MPQSQDPRAQHPTNTNTTTNSSHLARSSSDDPASSSTTIPAASQDPDESEALPRSQSEAPLGLLDPSPTRYRGYPLGSIGSSLASSHPALHKYLYRRYSGTYVCQYCNKTFFRLFSLQRHEQVHTGLKPCFCKECGKGFSEPRNLRQHMIRYHSDHSGLGGGGGNGHAADEEMLHSIRRLRRPISSGLPRTSQRLAPVTPDMIEEAERLEKQAAMHKAGLHTHHQSGGARALTASPPTAYDFSKLPASPVYVPAALERSRTYSAGSEPRGAALTSPTAAAAAVAVAAASSSATSQLKIETTSPVAGHHHHHHPSLLSSSSAFGSNPSPVSAASVPPPQPSPSGHLASQIRQKEKLSEDVVVIIPSDAPLEGSEPSVITPRSAVSDTPSWPEPGGSDTDSTQSADVIQSAPRRSMMMDYKNLQQLRATRERRKGQQPIRIPSPSDDQEIAHLPPQEQFSPPSTDRASVIREKPPSPGGLLPGPPSAPRPDSNSPPTPLSSSSMSMNSPTMVSMASAGMLFPGAPDLSNTTSALPGLPGTPPLYLGPMLHPGLLSPSTLPLLRGAAPGLLHPGAPPTLDPATAMRLGLPTPTAWAAAMENFSSSGSSAGATGSGEPRMPNPYAKGSASAGRNSRYAASNLSTTEGSVCLLTIFASAQFSLDESF